MVIVVKEASTSEQVASRSQAPTDLSPERRADLRRLEKRIGYEFKDLRLADRAFTHRSFAHDYPEVTAELRQNDYESLEFLGDAILGFIISESLYRNYPQRREGELSKLKSHLVSASQLASLSEELGLGEFLKLSRGEEKTGGRKKRALLADLFESLTAAIFLDGGIRAARRFVLSRFEPLLRQISRNELAFKDYKSLLQERLHERGGVPPSYRLVAEVGPDHRKEFSVEVVSEGEVLASGTGRSKKEAEQHAARLALEVLNRDNG